ncbi:MAG: Hsp20/alpha crystallin family protein [Anaerolineae bacterium]|nr:Hsp20/alpha crystallin family protein [Anaerolineae bacterium]
MSDEHSLPDKATGEDREPETQTNTPARRWVIVRHTTVWQPPTDIYERDNRLIVLVEIAGMKDENFNVTLHGHRLTISGVRPHMASAECAYHQLEISFGEFRTEVDVPWPVTRDDVTALYRDGFLRVELPHAPARQIHIVNVDGEDEADS